MSALERSAFEGARVAFGTRHGKQHQVGPVLADLLGVQVVVPRTWTPISSALSPANDPGC